MSVAASASWFAFLADRRSAQCLHGRQRLLSVLGNPLAQFRRLPTPAFDMPKDEEKACLGGEGRAYLFPVEDGVPRGPHGAHWKGMNLCWAWMKKVGCYDASWGTISWREGQKRAAAGRVAPPPEELLMQPIRRPDLCEWYALGAPLTDVKPREAEAAKEWFAKNVSVYVLNLDRDVARWAAVSSRLRQLGMAFERVPGVDLTVPGGYAAAKKQGLIPKDFNFTEAQENARTDFQNMGGILGTVGCASAHLRAMKAACNNSKHGKPLALVLEDDVILADDFIVKLRRLLDDEAPCDWSVISLRSKCPYGVCVSPHLTRVLPDGNEPWERCRHGVNYGFFAMLYRLSDLEDLRSRLASAVWDEERPHCLDVDVALASLSDEIAYYAVPNVQVPGFLSEGGQGSSRTDLNAAALVDAPAPNAAVAETSTSTTSTTTTTTTSSTSTRTTTTTTTTTTTSSTTTSSSSTTSATTTTTTSTRSSTTTSSTSSTSTATTTISRTTTSVPLHAFHGLAV